MIYIVVIICITYLVFYILDLLNDRYYSRLNIERGFSNKIYRLEKQIEELKAISKYRHTKNKKLRTELRGLKEHDRQGCQAFHGREKETKE